MTIEAASRTAGAWATPARLATRLAALAGWRRWAMALGVGALASVAMPPAYAAPLLWICFPALLWLLDGARSRWGAFFVGWTFGFGFFVFGLYWIAWALTVDLARFFWMIPFAVAGVPALLAAFVGLATLALHLWAPRGIGRALAFAALWAVAEWLRGHVLTGFPWNLVGYAWVGWLPVLQATAWIGIYGLGALMVAAASLPAALAWRPGRAAWPAVAAGILLFVVIAAVGSVRLSGNGGATVPGVVLRLVQPNIDQVEKWNADLRLDHFGRQLEMAVGPGSERVTHVIWAETAVPFILSREPEGLRLIGTATPPGGLSLVGSPRATPEGEPLAVWNSLYAVDPSGAVVATYDKAHLVPFGEYVPFRSVLPIGTIVPGQVDYSPGPGPRTIPLPGLPPVSPLICYEAIFPGAVVDDDAPRPGWLLNITNDGWYGLTAGPHQHFAMTRARAVEEGLPLVRVANTGISGVVDPYGRVTASLGLGEAGVLDAPLPEALAAPPPYPRWRDVPFWLLVAAGLAAGLIARRW